MPLPLAERMKYLKHGLLICIKCEATKRLTEFNPDKNSKTGYKTRCKGCLAQDRKEQFEADPGMRLRHHLKSSYGVTLDEFRQMEADQGGVCRICSRPPEVGGQPRLSVKLHPETLELIALLCNNCMHGLGKFRDDPEILRRAADLLEGHDAVATRR